MLLRAVAIRHHRFQTDPVGGTHFDDDPLAHAPTYNHHRHGARQIGLVCQILSTSLKRFSRSANEFHTYIANNAHAIPNYAERWRYGERVATSFVEATVNLVVGKRFAKRQQMQWSKQGAHLLLQTRTRTLDGTLRPMFARWYPAMVANDQNTSTLRVAA